MTTLYATAPDGLRIAYDAAGDGPALLLLHGFSNDRTMWHEHGYVERLRDRFAVITTDLRSCGESDAPADHQDYIATKYVQDFHAVADACGMDRFAVWGWSFGATNGLQLAVHSPRLTRAVIAGTVFGRIFSDERIDGMIEQATPFAEAKAQGTLDQLDLKPSRRQHIERTNFPVLFARWHSMRTWPGVEPHELRRPTFVYTGTNDGNVIGEIEARRADIEAAGVQLHIFAGLDHLQLVSQIDTVLPRVLPFLQHAART